MYSKTNKVLSIAMSAAILLTNIMTPMKVYADEVNEPAQDLESEMLLETEPLSYYLTLPYYEEVSYSVDKNHMETKDSQDKDIRLAYHEEEKVEFSFQTADTVQVMEIHLKDNEKQEVPFSIDENRKVSLAMPAKDLDLTLVLEDIPAPAPAPDTEQPVATGSTMENPVSQDEGINEFDLTAQEVSGDQYLYPSDDGTQDSDQNGQADENPADNEDQETGSDQQPGGAGDEADLQEGEDAPLNGSEEGSGDTAGESNPETPGIALTAETEADGLPSQGSILTVDTLTIPLMDVDFNPKTDFTHISFSSEKDQVELVSDEVDITMMRLLGSRSLLKNTTRKQERTSPSVQPHPLPVQSIRCIPTRHSPRFWR